MKIKSIVMFVLAFGLLASTAQANFFGFRRGGGQNQEERGNQENQENNENRGNRFGRTFGGLGNLFGGGRNDREDRGRRLWNLFCGENNVEWNIFSEGFNCEWGERVGNREGGNGIREFNLPGDCDLGLLKICKLIAIVKTIICENPPEIQRQPRLLRTPQPPSSAVPEPSTYGVIGAGALLGLVFLRRFKNKR